MSEPQECSVCWAACVKYYSTDVVWGGGGGWSVHVKTTKRYLSFESSLRECCTVLRLCLHACTLCVCTRRVDMHVYVNAVLRVRLHAWNMFITRVLMMTWQEFDDG